MSNLNRNCENFPKKDTWSCFPYLLSIKTINSLNLMKQRINLLKTHNQIVILDWLHWLPKSSDFNAVIAIILRIRDIREWTQLLKWDCRTHRYGLITNEASLLHRGQGWGGGELQCNYSYRRCPPSNMAASAHAGSLAGDSQLTNQRLPVPPG